jgi:tetratricopeptide (TPR) repeat protein
MNLLPIEYLIYGTIILTNIIIAWQIAKTGLFELGIHPTAGKVVFPAMFIGMGALFIAGYMQKNGVAPFAYLAKDKYVEASLVSLAPPLLTFLIARYVVLPRGLPEFNRARTRILYWQHNQTVYSPGTIHKEGGDALAQHSRAKDALDLLDRSIVAQKRGSTQTSIERIFPINDEQVGYNGSQRVSCPNCGFEVGIPMRSEGGSGNCSMCGAHLAFKIIGTSIHLHALGVRAQRKMTLQNKKNIATAYSEKGILLRMMNRFNDARTAYQKGHVAVSEALTEAPNNAEVLAIQSLLFFREGELEHAVGKQSRARASYTKSIEIDKHIGDERGVQVTTEMLGQLG